jgi:hypothetical protein
LDGSMQIIMAKMILRRRENGAYMWPRMFFVYFRSPAIPTISEQFCAVIRM